MNNYLTHSLTSYLTKVELARCTQISFSALPSDVAVFSVKNGLFPASFFFNFLYSMQFKYS